MPARMTQRTAPAARSAGLRSTARGVCGRRSCRHFTVGVETAGRRACAVTSEHCATTPRSFVAFGKWMVFRVCGVGVLNDQLTFAIDDRVNGVGSRPPLNAKDSAAQILKSCRLCLLTSQGAQRAVSPNVVRNHVVVIATLPIWSIQID